MEVGKIYLLLLENPNFAWPFGFLVLSNNKLSKNS